MHNEGEMNEWMMNDAERVNEGISMMVMRTKMDDDDDDDVADGNE